MSNETTKVVMLPTSLLVPNPANPRKDVGDVTELADSIRSQGIRQNLLVVPTPGKDTYTLVIGHRRLAAAKVAGVEKVPCVIADMSEREQHELMLVENIQRTDLTPLEEADGFQGLLDLGETAGEIATATGRSASTVAKRLRIASIPSEVRSKVSEAAQPSLEQWEQISHYASYPDLQEELVKAAGTDDWDYTFSHVNGARDERRWRADVSVMLKSLRAHVVAPGEYGYDPDEVENLNKVEDFWHGEPLKGVREKLEKRKDLDRLTFVFDPDDGVRLGVFAPYPPEEAKQRRQERAKRDAEAAAQKEQERPIRDFDQTSRRLRFDFLRRLETMKTTPTHAGEALATMTGTLLKASIWDAERRIINSLRTLHEDHQDTLEADAKALLDTWDSPTRTILACSLITEDNLNWYSLTNTKQLETWNAYYHALTLIGYTPSSEEKKALAGGFIQEEEK